MQKLNFKKMGEGKPLFILHGLFGMLDNWKSFANELTEEFTIYLVDLRNHGHSFHSDEMDYELMAQDLAKLMDKEEIERAFIMGHSMGGKTAMTFSSLFPDKTKKLIVVDIAPKKYQAGHDEIFQALRSLPVEEIEQRKDARQHLEEYIDEEGVRLFLLKNLNRKDDGSYTWRMNLEGIYENYDHILEALPESISYEGPTLFISGERSKYIEQEDHELIKKQFPNAQIETIGKAGHWVHVDQKEALLENVRSFLNAQ